MTQTRTIGRYALFAEIAAGGMATVHVGRVTGAIGFSRTVAIKRLHPQFAKDPDFVAMFMDEARLAARVRHPNVVPVVDVVSDDGELFLVMEYVAGESLAKLRRTMRDRKERPPIDIAVAILIATLHGLHAAHEATDDRGEPLGIVHRDVSPQNVLVGADGVARVLDFGVAKAAGRLAVTREGQLKGKVPYMAPEQIRDLAIDRRTDVYAAAVVLHELVTGEGLFRAESEVGILERVLHQRVPPMRDKRPDVPEALDAIVLRALDRDRDARFATADEMARALERAVRPATQGEVARWVRDLAGEALNTRAETISSIERDGFAIPAPLPSERADHETRASLATSPERIERKKTAPLVAVALGAIAAATAFTFYAMAKRGHVGDDAKAAVSALPSASIDPSPTAQSVASSVSTSASPLASASAPPAPAPTAKKKPSFFAVPAKPPRPPPAATNCYEVDSDGIKHIRPSCL